MFLPVKGAWSNKLRFFLNDASSAKKSWFQISVQLIIWIDEATTLIVIAYTSLCKLYYGYHITSHIFINIFQRVCFSAVKLIQVIRKIWASFWCQNLGRFEKKKKKKSEVKQSNWAPIFNKKFFVYPSLKLSILKSDWNLKFLWFI